MQDQPPPLSPEDVASLSAVEYAQLGEPQVVKVFGILHLIFGGYGILMIIWTLYVTLVGNPFLALVGSSPQAHAQAAFEKEISGYTLGSTALYALITVIIIMAGILLLKGRRNALKYSNLYAWLSIASKVINLVIGIVYVLPMSKQLILTSSSGSGMATSSMEVMMISTLVATFIFGLIYPILALALLNRPYVKTWIANQPA